METGSHKKKYLDIPCHHSTIPIDVHIEVAERRARTEWRRYNYILIIDITMVIMVTRIMEFTKSCRRSIDFGIDF